MAIGIFTLRQQLRGLLSKNWTGTIKTPYVEYLVVGGGGGSQYGGAGGGGVLTGLMPVVVGATNNVTVGGGGAANSAGTGSNSSLNSVIANGGGNGAYSATTATSGGSGSGQLNNTTTTIPGGQGIFGQGNSGGNTPASASGQCGSGGGGAGTAGLPSSTSSAIGGNGGAGIASAISGTVTPYGGGGGGMSNAGTAGTGGVGGGGNGSTGTGAIGQANTGGGAGGGNSGGAAGGSGIVIVSYPDIYAALTTGGSTSPTVSTSGSGSISFTGVAGATYIYYANQTPFALGTGDWTIEFWVNPTVTAENEIVDFRPSGTDGVYPTIYATVGKLYYFVNNANRIVGTTTLSNSTWYHVAVSKISNVTKMYLNGVQEGSSYSDTNTYLVGTDRPILGARTTAATGFNGLISNLRIVKGVGVYTGTFTSPTAPLQATQSAGTNIAAITGTSTSLLLNTVSGARTADNSTNGYAPNSTSAAAPAWNQSSPFATGLGYKNRVYSWTTTGSGTFTV